MFHNVLIKTLEATHDLAALRAKKLEGGNEDYRAMMRRKVMRSLLCRKSLQKQRDVAALSWITVLWATCG